MIVSEIDQKSIKLCKDINIAAEIFLDKKNKKFNAIILQSLEPTKIVNLFTEKIKHYNGIKSLNEYWSVVQMEKLTIEDLQSDKLLIILTTYPTNMAILNYSYRNVIVLNFVYGNTCDGSNFYLNFMLKQIDLRIKE